MQYNAERGGGFNDVSGDRDIGLRGGGVPGRMVVHQDQRRGAELERALYHLASIDRRVVDGAALLTLVLDEHVLAIEKQEMELLNLAVSDLSAAIVDELIPRADHRPFLQLGSHQPERCLPHQFDTGDRRRVETHSSERLDIGAQHLGEAPEALDQVRHQRFCIGARVGGEKYHLKEFGIGKIFRSGKDQTPAQSFPMAVKAAALCRRHPQVALREAFPIAAPGPRDGSSRLGTPSFGIRHDRSLSRWTDAPNYAILVNARFTISPWKKSRKCRAT